MNAIAGHRIAEVSIHCFVSDVAAYLRQALSLTGLSYTQISIRFDMVHI